MFPSNTKLNPIPTSAVDTSSSHPFGIPGMFDPTILENAGVDCEKTYVLTWLLARPLATSAMVHTMERMMGRFGRLERFTVGLMQGEVVSGVVLM